MARQQVAVAVALLTTACTGLLLVWQSPNSSGIGSQPGKQGSPSADVVPEKEVRPLPVLTSDGTDRPPGLRLYSAGDSMIRAAVARYPNLRRLSLVKCDALTTPGLRMLKQFAKLEDLRVSHTTALADEDFVTISQLTGLRRLQLGAPNLDDASVARLLPLVELRELAISGGARVTGEGIASIVTGMPHLERLDLTQTRISDRDLEALARAKQLRELSLPRTVTDDGLTHLTGLPRLEFLLISGGKAITDRGMKVIAKCSSLRHLYIAGAAVTDAGVEALKPLTKLESLILSSTQVRGTAFESLTHLQSLERLNLWGTQFQPECIDFLSELKGLRSLDVGWMPHLTETEQWRKLGRLQQLTRLVEDVNRPRLNELRSALPKSTVETTDLTEWP